MDLTVGQTIGDYEVLGVLGAGGMGKVYQVRNNISHRVEAMKVLLPDLTSDSELVDRFLREIRISASLDHPNIAALRTAQRIDNQLVMVMEFVEGLTFDALMQTLHIPVEKAIDYMLQALSALSYAHSRGVIHRDIKPGNIMLTPAGTVKLMDFGIAKLATDRKLTKTGVMVGSVYYMSPEQIEGRELDARSDIYSLGVTLYQIATGQRPFNGDSEYQIMAAHLKGLPQPPREIDHALPAALNDIILMAMAKDAGQRFQSADAFRGALASIASKAAAAAAPAAAPPPPEPKKDRRVLYMVAGSLATLAVIAAAVVEIPKYWHASAVGQAPVAKIQPGPAAPRAPAKVEAPVQTPVQTPEQPAAAPTPTTIQQSAPQPATQFATRSTATNPARPVKGIAQSINKPVAAARPQAAPLITAQTPPVQPPPQQAAPVQTPAAPAPDSAELSNLRERMMLMAARVGSVTTSLQNLQREQARQGVGLRSDMVAAQQRVNYQMDEAESSIKQNHAADAKKRLDAAERDLEKLESFLGK